MEYADVLKLRERLEEWSSHDTSETGDAVYHLIELCSYPYIFSEAFNENLYEEMKRQIRNYEEFAEIVEEEIVPPPHIIKRIHWK